MANHRLARAAASLALAVVLSLLALSAIQAQTEEPSRSPHAAPLDVVINEIAWMGTTVSSSDEWIELYNNTAAPINLAGWTLHASDGTPSISLAGTIPAGGYFLLERTDDTTVPGVPADRIYAGALGDAGENLILRDNLSTIIDEVPCGLGWFSGHADGRVPMVRINPLAAGSLANNWTYSPRCGTATNSAGISHTCTLTVTAVGQPLDYAVYFNPWFTATATTTSTTPMEEALLDIIDGASTSIDIALYGLNRQSVIDALVAAHNRGMTVRVVGDDEAATVSYIAGYQALTNAGIPVVIDASMSKLQHNKFLVVDGSIVWTGSTNFTDTCLTLNANNSIVITDTTLAAIYTAEFEEMWAGLFHEAKADNTAHLLDYDGASVESFFSPTDLVAFEVWNELAAAEDTIHFAMFFWTDDVLTDRVIERLNAGVEVYGVWDELGAANAYSADEALCQAGARIKVEDFAGKLHHKFAVIDVWGDDPVVILGSYNWTDSGAYDNDENTLIIHDRALAQSYYAEWARLWSALGVETMCNPPAETFGVEFGPDHFRQAVAGQSIVYDHVLTNTGSTTDTFLLEFTSTLGWPTVLLAENSPSGAITLSLEVAPQMTASVQVSLTVPLDAGGTEVTTITATSQLSPTVRAVAIDTTSVSYSLYLPTVTRSWPPIPNRPTLNAISNADGDGEYTVSWTELPDRIADTYTLQEATNSSFTSGLRTVCTTSQQSCNVSGKIAGTYYYRVRGHTIWADSNWSETRPVTVLLPGTPTLNAIGNADGDGDYTVTWNATARATSYILQEDNSSAFSNPITSYSGDGQSWPASGKAVGTYYYRVRAVGPTGQSLWSNTQSVVVRPPADVKITYIEYDPPGDDMQGEYVRIQNLGGRAANMTGWTLQDIAGHTYTFPIFTLNGGATVRVWTKGGTNTSTDLYWGRRSAVWNNDGDCAYLRDSSGVLVSSYCY